MRQHGFSLIELLLALSLLAILMTLAVPERSTPRPEALDLAATEVFQALRFARSEAMRTGAPHGVEFTAAGARIQVYKRDRVPLSRTLDYTVRHPVSRQVYDVDFDLNGLTQSITIDLVDFQYASIAGSQDEIDFDADGLPHLYSGGQDRLLKSGIVDVGNGVDTITVDVQPYTGRVTRK